MPETQADDGPLTERKLVNDNPDFSNISAINEELEPEELDKNKKVQLDNIENLYDSTANSYFGDSEAAYERDSRKRAKNISCLRMFYRLISSVAFNFFIFLLIIANTTTLALYRYD